MKARLLCVLVVLFAVTAHADHPADASNGQVYTNGDFSEAWDANTRQWVSLERFWANYSDRRGLKWGRSSDYPPYADVSEHDLLLLELDSGVCLMEFFHSRWRRAQDVRRWSDAFNEYGGCPDVFK